LHGSVWLIFLYINIRYLENWLPTIGLHKSFWQVLGYSLIYLPLLFAAPYAHYFFFVPKFFLQKKYLFYTLFLLISFAAGSYLTAILDYIFIGHENQDWLLSNTHVWSRIPLLVLFTLLATWARMTEEVQKQQKKQQQLEQQQTAAELKWLKAQVNPHFFFNALNNIHSLVHLKDDKAGPTLVKLSEMMRYVLYESESKTVPLQHEIEYLLKYVDLQSFKERWKPKIKLSIGKLPSDIFVAPLLFINFVENAFKHCNLEEEKSFVSISIEVIEHKILFVCKNSVSDLVLKDATSGIGLENVKQRLQLLYPSRHVLEVKEEDAVFSVTLALNL